MKFGVFLPNGSNGYIISNAVTPYLPTYQHNLEITVEAEKQGLDFVLSMMKFKGFGGDTGYWDACLNLSPSWPAWQQTPSLSALSLPSLC